MVSAEVHRARLDRFVRNWTLTFWWVAWILTLGTLVEVLGLG
jgi:hypothetical protein